MEEVLIITGFFEILLLFVYFMSDNFSLKDDEIPSGILRNGNKGTL